MTKYVLAFDLGTSGNKISLFKEDGNLIADCTKSYPTKYFNQNWAEQNPQDWWDAVCQASTELLQVSKLDPKQIVAISFSGHMMGCLCLDQEGKVLRPHILWADLRAEKQAKKLGEKIEPERFYQITGHRNSASYSLQKLMWIKENEADIYAKTAYCLNAKDYIAYLFTGRICTDPSDATGTAAMDLNKLEWSEEIIAAAGLDLAKFPEIVPSTTNIGGITKEAAKATGLAEGTAVIIGGGDGVAAAVGAASIKEDFMYCSLGTSSWISYTSTKPLFDREMKTFSWAHMVPGLYAPCGTMQTAGSSYSWVKNEIAKEESKDKDPYGKIQTQMNLDQPGANGVYFLPYLLGERSPWWNTKAKGAFIGLKMENKRGDLFQATLEGITMNLDLIFQIFQNEGRKHDAIHLIGGGARSKEWCQLFANVMNVKIKRMNHLEIASSIGAAVCAGVGVGLFQDFSHVDKFIQVQEIFEPEASKVEEYAKIKVNFKNLYLALKDVYEEI